MHGIQTFDILDGIWTMHTLLAMPKIFHHYLKIIKSTHYNPNYINSINIDKEIGHAHFLYD
jgi:hypothetical protein